VDSNPVAPATRFLVLGSLEVRGAQGRLPLGGPRQERILAVLLLEANRTVPVSRLIEAVWDDGPPNTAEHQIRKSIADLRRRLPDGPEVIRTDGAGYRVVLEAAQFDLAEFTGLVRLARKQEQRGETDQAVEGLQLALDLWRGEILGGAGGPVVDAAAVALHEQRLAAAEHLAELRLSRGDSAQLIGMLRSLAQEHPLRESLRAQLMLALYQGGRQAEALEEYERIRRLLSEELGTDPDPKLVKLYEAILHNSLDLAPAEASPAPAFGPWPGGLAPSTLPYDLPDFVGRTEESAQLEAVAEQAGADGARIVVIDAMGGAGKTALAIHAAHRIAAAFPDGRLYIDLHGFTPGHPPLTPEAALGMLLRAVGVGGDMCPDELEGRTALWRTITADRSLLLVFDNAADATQLRPLLPSSPICLAIVTSRNHLLELDGTVTIFLGALSESGCRKLLELTIGAERVGADPEATTELIRLCGRLPLALRIAAARLRARPRWTIGHMVDRLRDEARRLDELSVPERSVAAILRSSYQLLLEPQQSAFRLLGLHPGADLDVYAAAALLGKAVTEADEILEDLLDAHLLEQHDEGRYVFHDLVRAFAHQLTGSGTEQADQTALAGLAGYYIHTVDRACGLLFPARMQPSWEHASVPAGPAFQDAQNANTWFEAELPNLVAMVRAALAAGLLREAAYLPRGVILYLHAHGHSQELLEVGETPVAAARALGDPGLLRLSLTNVTLGYWHLGRFGDALARLAEARDLAVLQHDEYGEAVCLGHLAVFESHLGRYADALRHVEHATSLLANSGNARQLINLLVTKSDVLIALSRFAEAAETAAEAVEITERSGELRRTGLALVNLAEAHIGSGDGAAALVVLARADALYREQRRPLDCLLVQARSAEAHLALGDHGRALDLAQALANTAELTVPPARRATIGNALGRVFAAAGRTRDALRWHRSAYAKAEQIGFVLEMAHARLGMARVLAAAGQPDEAETHEAEAAALFESMDMPAAPSAIAERR
jgi:DNA-binding SARP family transcriptional activator